MPVEPKKKASFQKIPEGERIISKRANLHVHMDTRKIKEIFAKKLLLEEEKIRKFKTANLQKIQDIQQIIVKYKKDIEQLSKQKINSNKIITINQDIEELKKVVEGYKKLNLQHDENLGNIGQTMNNLSKSY